jgi:hypothetical protein
MTRVIATASDAGRSCPYCRFPVKEGTAAERCDSCSSLHHEDCWNDGCGCAVLGCQESGRAAAVAAAGLPAGWPGSAYQPGVPIPPQTFATPVSPGYGAPPGYPPPPSAPVSPPRSGNQTILVVAVTIALLGIGTGVVVATGALSTRTQANTATRFPAANPSAQAPPARLIPAEEASDRGTIMSILGDYQNAYSQHEVAALSNLFTPGITRHGLAAGGCRVSHGRSQVLENYQSQFAEGTGAYRLVGFAEDQIQFNGKTQATLDAHYDIEPGNQTGYVNFKFADIGEGWRISEIYATCE